VIETYRASGRCGSRAIPCTLLAAVFLGAAGWVYQILLDLIPLLYARFLLTAGLALLVLFTTDRVATLARCRSVALAAGAGVLAAVVCLLASHAAAYHHWRRDMQAAIEALPASELVPPDGDAADANDVRQALLADLGVGRYVKGRVAGGWTVGEADTGFHLQGLVGIVWLVEAVALLGAGALGGRRAVLRPFCERCGRWAAGRRGRLVTMQPDTSTLHEMRRAATVEDLLPPATSGTGPPERRLVHELTSCPGCGAAFLEVREETVTRDEKGKEHVDRRIPWAQVVVDEAWLASFDAVRKGRTTPRRRPAGPTPSDG